MDITGASVSNCYTFIIFIINFKNRINLKGVKQQITDVKS